MEYTKGSTNPNYTRSPGDPCVILFGEFMALGKWTVAEGQYFDNRQTLWPLALRKKRAEAEHSM